MNPSRSSINKKNSPLGSPVTQKESPSLENTRALKKVGVTSRLRPSAVSVANRRSFPKIILVLVSCLPAILVVIAITSYKPGSKVENVTYCPVCKAQVRITAEEQEKQIIFKCPNGDEFIINNQAGLKEAREFFRKGKTLFQEAMEMDVANPQRQILFQQAQENLDQAMKFYDLLEKNNEPVAQEIDNIQHILKEIRSRRTK